MFSHVKGVTNEHYRLVTRPKMSGVRRRNSSSQGLAGPCVPTVTTRCGAAEEAMEVAEF